MENKPIPAGAHKLPPLPYAANALEPVIDEKTLTIHHGKHHRKYVDDLNKTELALVSARAAGDYGAVNSLENDLAFNGSGHILHSVYWTIMSPVGQGGQAGEYTKSYVDWYFGGFKQFEAQFKAAAGAVQGSGWCILGYNPAFFRLEILQASKHQDLTQWGLIPILVCDVWEHAYYLKYQNNRSEYISGWWSLINWEEVERRFVNAAKGVMLLHN